MTKRIILSLAMIALTIAGVTSATVAYFSDTAVKGDNTFVMGTVIVEHIEGLPFMFETVIPGEQRESDIITVENTGSIAIDLYVGEKHTDGDGDFQGVVNYAINEVLADGTFVKTWVNWR
ncbi:SipW-dependent-type signal peptide-containing protein, partial [Patescibacteria group bacterium]|nr:SipW-dependent-type signal peptide-containing protein [Patescibacteria group bacterium]